MRDFGGSFASMAVTATISTPTKEYAAIGIPALGDRLFRIGPLSLNKNEAYNRAMKGEEVIL